jgi:hypothetical protein
MFGEKWKKRDEKPDRHSSDSITRPARYQNGISSRNEKMQNGQAISKGF